MATIQILESRQMLAADFGVTFPDDMHVGQLTAQISVAVPEAAPNAHLDAWIDWNADGNCGGAAEHVAVHLPLAADPMTLIVDVPALAHPGPTTLRLQLSTPDGRADVPRDYPLILLPPTYPSGLFGPAIPIDTTAAVQFISTADLDRDGDLDILSATFDGVGAIAWYENDGNQQFLRHVITTDALDATSVLVADMNGDGYLDVVAASLGNNAITWYQNDGQQQFTRLTITTSAYLVSSLHVADLDGDGDADIVAASKGDNVIAWYENSGEEFVQHVITTSVDVPCSVSAADFDADGDLDVISASFFDDTVAWYENDGSQNFVKRIIDEHSDGVRGMYVADLDGDGDQDVVSSCLYANTIQWYENDGQGDFAVHIISSTAIRAAAVYVADMDGDGDLDVLGSSRGDQTIAWFENTGNLHFPQHTITTTNPEARAVIAADVDGDGDLDVLSASKYGNCLAWFENLVNPTPITTSLDSISPAVTTQPTIPVTVTFNTPIKGFTAESLIVQNGTVTNFTGDSTAYSFDLIASGEGTVTVTLPKDAVTDAWGYRNAAAILTREFTMAPPVLSLGGGVATFLRDGKPVNVAPQLTVSGSRVGGGTLVVVISSARPGKPPIDVFDESALGGLGTVNRTTASGKWITSVSLNTTATVDDIQDALRSMTFSTSKVGTRFRTREVRIQLTDNSGQSKASLIQTIHLRRRETVR